VSYRIVFLVVSTSAIDYLERLVSKVNRIDVKLHRLIQMVNKRFRFAGSYRRCWVTVTYIFGSLSTLQCGRCVL